MNDNLAGLLMVLAFLAFGAWELWLLSPRRNRKGDDHAE